MSDLFGGALTITDNFSNTLSKFSSSLSSAGSSFNNFTSEIGAVERANRVSLSNMQNDMKRYTDFYVSQGYSMKQAISKATSSISDNAPTSGNAWIDVFGKIKQAGTDAFDGIGKKVENFSNSTLGTITKLTAGFASFEGIKKGLETGFETGSDYQNLRLVLNNLYGNTQTGGEKFKMSTDFASNSIWDERSVVRSLAMLKGSGLKDDKNSLTEMSDLGSYEKSMGVGDINTATRAYMEMMSGRFNMMTMELGIKREDVEAYAKKNNMQSFDDKNGKITNKSALETAFKGFIDQRGLTGLSDKMKDTASGRLSTLKDNINKSLADLIGVGNDGAVKSGSMFQKFCDGMSKFTTKIQQFSETENFNKLSTMISNFGDSLYNGFSFILDHPELVGNLLKFGVALFAVGKIGSLVSTISSIATLFGEGGLLASLGAVLAPIALPLAVIVGGFLALKSLMSPDGLLNKGIGTLLGTFLEADIQKGWEDNTNALAEFFRECKEGWKMLLGLPTTDTSDKNTETDPSKLSWYGGKDGKSLMTDTSNIQFKTASDMVKNGELVKTDATSKTITNKNEINLNVAKVEKTADVDELMDTVTKRLNQYSQTRNNLTT